MNRIETKIIVMVTNRLAAAKDSQAKDELIEELSENLYQRYLDLAAGGVPEAEALQQAMDSLGDVSELLDYLKTETGEAAEEADDPSAEAEGQREQSGESNAYKQSRAGNRGFSFSTSNLERSIEEICNMAMAAAKVAMDSTKDVVQNVSEQIKEKYPNGIYMEFNGSTKRTVDCTSIDSQEIRSIEVQLTNGDVELVFDSDVDAPITITGETEEIVTELRENGVLFVRQGNTASSSAMFMRGMRTSDIEICLPERFWDSISITTTNGDVHLPEGLECKNLAVRTTNGDVEACEVTCERMVCKMLSGDLTCDGLSGELLAETKSGDIEVSSANLTRCAVSSASGDISFDGICHDLTAGSISGDVTLSVDTLPDRMKASSTSGDCQVEVPEGTGFRLQYRTTSGDFNTNLTLAGTVRGKGGEVTYLDGGTSLIQISTVSGDITLNA